MWVTLIAALIGAAPTVPTVVLRDSGDPAMARRLRAQLVDTGWRLEEGPARPPGDPLYADLELADARRARAVLEIVRTGQAVRVRLTDAYAGRGYLRAVPSLDDGPPGPVTSEAAAVLVRDSLVALSQAGRIDWWVEAELPPWRVEVGLSARGTWDGAALMPGVGVRMEMGRTTWWAAVTGEFGLARGLDYDDVALRLQRHQLRFSVLRRFGLTEALHLDLGPSAGLGAYRRITQRPSDGAASEPRTTLVGLFGLEARLSLDLGWGRAWLGAGADAQVGAPRFSVTRGETEQMLATAWPVAPWAAAGFSVSLGDPITGGPPSVPSEPGRAGP